MSNLNKANNLASEWVESMGGLEAIRHDHGSDLSGLMQALDDAGLLAPDLPEPYPYSGEVPCWYEGAFRAGISSTFGGQKPNVTFTNLEPGGVVHMDSESARELAHALLAAAEHAEKEQVDIPKEEGL